MTSIVVIGAGLAGSSAAWRPAQPGHDVVVLEQDLPAHGRGSSHGSARIFRYAFGDRLYVDLVRESARGWAELVTAACTPGRPEGRHRAGGRRDGRPASRPAR